MLQPDPELPINCPDCGAPLTYLGTTEAEKESQRPEPDYFLHHFSCSKCGSMWKFGLNTPLLRDT